MSSDRFAKGRAIRRQVLAPEHVDPQLVKAQGHWLLEPFQQLNTEFAYGDVWTRGTISLKTRSLLTVGMLIALNRSVELQAHMRGAKRNGATFEEIREVILHSIVYAGFPAASDGIRVALQVYGDDADESDAKPGKTMKKSKSKQAKKKKSKLAAKRKK